MAEQIDGTGVITKTSSNSCVVSVTINGISKSFIFNKSLFYTFGVRCEGSMTNILEDGVEVELCYKVSHPEGKCCILAVWLGEKPDIMMEDEKSKAIYEVSGRVVSSYDNDNYLIRDEYHSTICINKGVVFRDGSLLPDDGTLIIDEELYFDALPFESEHPSGATLNATCAWCGPRPKVVDRFDLRPRDETEFPYGIVEGTVAAIPNDIVAIVDVVTDLGLTKVLLFRRSFKQGYLRLEDVNVGDRICLRLGYKSVLLGQRWSYAVEAFKSADEISLDSDFSKKAFLELESKNNAEITSVDHVAKKTRFGIGSEVLFCRLPLSGVISPLPFEFGACIAFGDAKIFVHHDNFYINSEQISVADFVSFIAPGNNVACFEAILSLKRFDHIDIEFTHEAVCAWAEKSKKPDVLVVGASLGISDTLRVKKEVQVFDGIVIKYYLPYIAFAYIAKESSYVFVHSSYFGCAPCYRSQDDLEERVLITSYVKLGDHVQFKLQKNPSFPGPWAYDVRLVRFPGDYVKEDCPRASCGEAEVAFEAKLRKSAEVRISNVSPASKLRPFRWKPVPESVGFLLNWSGVIKVQTQSPDILVTIEHHFGTCSVSRGSFFSEKVWANHDNLLKLNDVEVRFDAEFMMSPLKNSNFRILRLWKKTGLRPDPFMDHVLQLLLSSSLTRGETREVFYSAGKILSIPFHDAALAYINKVPILVPLDSLVSSEEINLNTSSIRSFLKLGDLIFTKVERQHVNDKSYFRVVRCFPGEHCPPGIHSDVQFDLHARGHGAWSEKWGLGEWYQKAPIKFAGGQYFVTFVYAEKNHKLCFDYVFKCKRIFVNEEVANPNMLKKYIGKTINFHVSVNSAELFIPCAWVGAEPLPKCLLGDILALPNGFISCTSPYEAVIKSFPLPTHATCYIGHVPVLVRIVGVNEKYCKHGDLKVGDRLIVSVYEESVGDLCVVLSDDFVTLAETYEAPLENVFRNVTGSVVSLPKPVGRIKVADADIVVAFESCHLRSASSHSRTARVRNNRECLAILRDQITVGKQVYVSAIKEKLKEELYRAFEVYLSE